MLQNKDENIDENKELDISSLINQGNSILENITAKMVYLFMNELELQTQI